MAYIREWGGKFVVPIPEGQGVYSRRKKDSLSRAQRATSARGWRPYSPRAATRSPGSTPASIATAGCTSIRSACRWRRHNLQGPAHGHATDFEGFDAVVHLAELSNDPLGENRPEITYKINHEGSVRIAKAAKEAGVKRSSTPPHAACTAWARADFLDETSPTNPQTAYAKCKVKVERDVAALADADFCVAFLRNATAYGPSPRMRFDIVLNDLSALAWTTKKIAMASDGSPWRPIVHIEDIIEAMRCALEAPAEAVNGEIFNVGATGENYRVREIAEIVPRRSRVAKSASARRAATTAATG